MAKNLNFEAAFQANTGELWIVGRDNLGDMKLGMMAGTNPSIAVLPEGGWQAAFQANTGNLWIVGTKDNRGDTHLGMMKGTSPCIAALPDGGWQAAFQANTGNLWVVGTKDNLGDMNLGMMAGTNPSISALPDGGWQAAFQANTGNLWIVGTVGSPGDLKLGMMAGTSPSISISAAGSGWQTAFQANTGNLWIVGTVDDLGDMNLEMMKGTSPSLSALSDGSWQAAFQASTGNLWLVGSKVSPGDLKLGMKPGTSPSLVALPLGNWQIGFQANTGNLWAVGTLENGDQGLGMDNITTPTISASCIYPASSPTSEPIDVMLRNLSANSGACRSLYLDTTKDMWGRPGWLGTGYNHAQGLARTHLLSTNSVSFFLTYSEIGSEGTLSQYQYSGPLDGAHIAEQNVETDPAAIAPREQILNVPDEHPCDLVFLPDVDNADAGYVFVALQHQAWAVGIYSWQGGSLNMIGMLDIGILLPNQVGALMGTGPGFLFLDKVEDFYYLGIAGGTIGLLFRARAMDLFPSCTPGSMCVDKFEAVPAADIVSPGIADAPPNTFAFPVNGDASQIKLIRDSTGQWYLFGFRCDPPSEAYTGGTDYIDVYPVNFSPFQILPAAAFSPQHVIFPSDGTSFASTGTHFVDPQGRLLVSSCFRWAEDKSDIAGYVTRLDELSSS